MEIQILFAGLLETGEKIEQDDGTWLNDTEGINPVQKQFFSLFPSLIPPTVGDSELGSVS